MAIKVNNYTVIDQSRALTNITSVDSTTAAAIGAAGVGGGGTIELTADGSISSGDAVGITTSGKVSTNAALFGPTSTSYSTTGYTQYPKCCWDESANKIAWVGRESTGSAYMVLRVGTVSSNNTITWGSVYTFTNATNAQNFGIAMNNNVIVVTWSGGNYGNYLMGASFGVRGTTINSTSGVQYLQGSFYSLGNNNTNYTMADPQNSGKFISVYGAENYLYPYVCVITATGTSLSRTNTRITTSSSNYSAFDIAYSYDYNKFMGIWTRSGNYVTVCDLDIVNGSLSAGTPLITDLTEDADQYGFGYDSTSGNYVYMSRSGGTAYAWVLNTNSSGVPQSWGGTNLLRTGYGGDYYGKYTTNSSGDTTVGLWGVEGSSKYLFLLSVSGEDISIANTINVTDYVDSPFSSNLDGLHKKGSFLALNKANASNQNTKEAAIVNTASSYFKNLGISEGNYSNGQTATITITGGVTNTKSGLVAGKYYGPDPASTGGIRIVSEDDAFAVATKTNELLMK